MLNLNSILVFSQNPESLVEFYKKVFQKDADWTGGDFTGFKVGDGMVVFGPHDKVHGKNTNPERSLTFPVPPVNGVKRNIHIMPLRKGE